MYKSCFIKYLSLLKLGIILAISGNVYAQTNPQPNVIFIFADDLGWGDLSCYGHPRLKTPALDRLASEGKLFTQFYVGNPVCSPSRAAIMTGRFPASLGIHGHLATPESNAQRGMPDYLDPELPNLTRTFQQEGYAVGHFGKWHLGHSPDAPMPGAYGIDEFRTNTSTDTADFKLWYPEHRHEATKMILDEAAAFMEKHQSQPFYINAWLVDPHAVLNPSPEQLEQFAWASPNAYARKYYGQEVPFYGATQIYYATLTEMDRQIGLFLDKLDALGLADNTIVIFSSDNGPEVMEIPNAAHSAAGSAGPFRGFKRSIYEGGVRVPLLVRWPGHIEAGSIESTSVVGAVDFLPTLSQLCGLKTPTSPDIDGEDRSAVWLGTPQSREKPLFWEWRFNIAGSILGKSPMLAIREGKWKLLMNPDRSRIELYDLESDPSELVNLAGRQKKVTRRLTKKLMAWKQSLPEGPTDRSAGSNAYRWPEKK